MLTTHIDIEVYKDAIIKKREYSDNNKRNQEKEINRFLDFIEDNTNLRFYHFKDDVDSLNLISGLLTGRGDHLKRPRKETVTLEDKLNNLRKKSPYQIFFVNSDNLFEQYKDIIIGNRGNYLSVFNKYRFEDQVRIGKTTSNHPFSSWEEFLPDIPVSEVIINDSYLFKQTYTKDEKEIIANIEQNAFRFFKALNRKYPELKNVIIFSFIDYKSFGCKKSDDGTYDKKCFNFVLNEIKEQFSQKVNVLLINNYEEHDRHIFSNYFYMKLSSINSIYNKEGKLIESKTSSFEKTSFLTSYQNFEKATDILKDFKKRFEDFNTKKKYYSFLLNNIDEG